MPSTEWTSAGLAFGQSGCAAMEVGRGALTGGVLGDGVLPACALADCAQTAEASRGKSARAAKRVRTMRRTVSHADAPPGRELGMRCTSAALRHGMGAVGDGAARAQGCGDEHGLGDLLIGGMRGACFFRVDLDA